MLMPYKFASWWGGQEGSLLPVGVAAFGDVHERTEVCSRIAASSGEMMPYVTAVLMTARKRFS